MSLYETFLSLGETFAAGLFELDKEDPIPRYANALKRYWEKAELAPYDGGKLYPCGKHPFYIDQGLAFAPHYAKTYSCNWNRMEALREK